MKGFRFRLDPVLTLRQHKEESLQVELAALMRAREMAEARRKGIESEIRMTVEKMSTSQSPGEIDVLRMAMENAYLRSLERQLVAQTACVEEQDCRVTEARCAVLKASQEKKAMEKLRADRLESFVKELSYKDQKAAEEVASVRHRLLAQSQAE